MPNLVDVLNSSKDRKEVAELGVLDTKIPSNLQALSAIVEKEFSNPGFYFYTNALSNFSQGFHDGNTNTELKTGMHESYNLGYNVASSLSHPHPGMQNSYERAMKQWQVVIPALRKELEVLMSINSINPLEFIISYIQTNIQTNDFWHQKTAQWIADVLNYDPEWSKNILRGNISSHTIDMLKRKDRLFRESVQLGIYHLLNGEPIMAHIVLGEAFQKSEEMPLGEALRHIYPNTLKAYDILKPAYEKVKVARGFGTEQLAA